MNIRLPFFEYSNNYEAIYFFQAGGCSTPPSGT